MDQVQRSHFPAFFPLVSLIVTGSLILKNSATAQIVPDNTLGSENSVVTPNQNIRGIPSDRIDGGSVRGSNLFHSFEQFNVDEGLGVYFSNPNNIINILTRVTGGDISQILGTLGVLGNANLFLINPNGIVFGPNARLDVGGSFFASSADSILFANGVEFSATNPQSPPLLTINIPLGLQLRNNPGDVQVQQAQLGVPTGQTLALVGGNIEINGGILEAVDGQVELGSVNEGIVNLEQNRLNLSTNLQRSDVTLNDNTNVNVRGTGEGNINIFARNLSILNSSTVLSAGVAENQQSLAGSTPGDIQLNATESITISGSEISNIVAQGAIGNSGQIRVTANNLIMIEGAALDSRVIGSGEENNQIPGQGNAGAVIIEVPGSVSLDQSFINTNIGRSVIGNSGEIQIQTGSLSLSNSSQLNTGTTGGSEAQPSQAGNVTITANNGVNLVGVGNVISDQQIGVFTQVDNNGIGQGGDITIRANSLTLNNGAVLDSRVIGSGRSLSSEAIVTRSGNSGTVRLNITGAISLNGVSLINTNVGRDVIGNSGTIEIVADSLTLRDRAALNSANTGTGDAGDITITITGNSLSLSETSNFNSRSAVVKLNADTESEITEERFGNAGKITINAERAIVTLNQSNIITTTGDQVIGNSGEINIRAAFLSLTNGSRIEANTAGGNTNQPSKDGNLNINVRDRIQIDGVNGGEEITPNDAPNSSGLFSQVTEKGEGISGNMEIKARSLTLTNGGQISSDTYGIGDTGYINIEVEDAVEISQTFDNGVNQAQLSGIFSRVNEGAVGSGQEIIIQANLLSIFDGVIDSRVIGSGGGNQVAGQGNAGSITFNIAEATTLNQAFINTNIGQDVLGNSGVIDIQSGSLLMTGGSQLNSNTSGGSFVQPSQAGEVRLTIRDRINLEGIGTAVDPSQQTKINTEVGNNGIGEAGQIKIEVTDGSLSLNNGATLVTRVRRLQTDENNGEIISAGQGNGGDVNINVQDNAIFDNNSVILTTVGDEVLGTRSGNVNIQARSIFLSNNSEIITATGGSQNALQTPSVAGNIALQARDTVTFEESRILSSATQKANQADGGNISVNSPSILLENSAVTAGDGFLNPVEENSAGQITINTPNLRLNTGILEADTQRDRTETASITVNTQDLRLRRQSNFTTNANETDGGNITINSETLVGLNNSDITANAEGGSGGVIFITADGIFGSSPLTRQQVEEQLGEEQIRGNPRFSQDLLQTTSDIVAISTSDAALSGSINLNSTLDPSKGLVDLPQNLIDPAALIAQDPCKQGEESEFTITGRGGIPSTPDTRFTGENVQVELVDPSLEENTTTVQPSSEERLSSADIIPARGWIRTANGDVILVGYDPTQSGIRRQPHNSGICRPTSEESDSEDVEVEVKN